MILFQNFIFFTSIFNSENILTSKELIAFEIKYSRDDYYYIESDPFGLFTISEFYDDIITDIFESIFYLWQEYIGNTVEELTSSESLQIKNNLSLFQKTQTHTSFFN